MGETLHTTTQDGHSLGIYVAHPIGPCNGSILVIQEVFGVNSHIRSVCDRYAEAGYVALAPALFDRVAPGTELGYDTAAAQQGMALRQQISWEQMLEDVKATFALAQTFTPIAPAIVGYCLGGSIAWLAASEIKGLRAAIGYYGGQIVHFLDKQPQCPVMLHFGTKDQHITAEHVASIATHHPEVTIHRYEADHGFNCDARASYDAPSAALALERTLGFLQHLK